MAKRPRKPEPPAQATSPPSSSLRVSGAVGLGWLEGLPVPVLAAWPVPSRRPGRRPLVLVLHGLLGRPLLLADWLAELALAGWVAAAPALPFGEDPELRRRLPTHFFEALDGAVQQAVPLLEQVTRALAGWRGADARRLAVVGISAGGFAALRLALRATTEGAAAAAGTSVAAVAAVVSGPGWLEVPAGLPQALQEELGTGGLSARPQRPFTADHYPGVHGAFVLERAEQLQGTAVLLCCGGRDGVVPVEPARQLHLRLARLSGAAAEEGRQQLLVYPTLGHRVTPPMKQRVVAWLRWMVETAPPAP